MASLLKLSQGAYLRPPTVGFRPESGWGRLAGRAMTSGANPRFGVSGAPVRNGRNRGVVASAVNSADEPVNVALAGWEDGAKEVDQLEEFSFAVLGDLHLDPATVDIFDAAREQIMGAISSSRSGNGAVNGVCADDPTQTRRIFQVGDLGGYHARPGSQDCFDRAREYLDSFPVPKALVLGNHDLEGDDFESDEENLLAWMNTFGQRHYWAMDCGPCVCIGLSTVQFRSAPYSCHEVFIDKAQVDWFEEMLAKYSDRKVFVFTHAPPMGSGLKVLQEIHVKNRCAWLNHSEAPAKFINIAERNPQIKLWLSGHFHLSHNYKDSISVIGRCAFVQVGVIGEDSSRDGFRHTRVLKGDSKGYQVYTLDHESGDLRLDLSHEYASTSSPEPLPVPPPEELLCNPEAGFFCAADDCDLDGEHAQWFPAGPKSIMSIQQNMLVEYDPQTRAAIGVVALDIGGCQVQLLDEDGRVIDVGSSDDIDEGANAAVVQVVDADGAVKCYKRNEHGGFFQVFQKNKWLLRKNAAELVGK